MCNVMENHYKSLRPDQNEKTGQNITVEFEKYIQNLEGQIREHYSNFYQLKQ